MPNISDTLKQASEILQSSGIRDARREAALLLALALRRDKTFLIAYPEYELSGEENARFREFLSRRASREPFQYIAGRQEFFGLDFEVTSDVLIPRPETELIVENAIEILRARENPFFCEVGVGSGCIAISILHKVNQARAIGLDVSENALAVAAKNAAKNSVSERLRLESSDVFANLTNEQFDLIVSNPPYIPVEDFEILQPEVRDFEPRNALTDERNGLSIVEKIINESPKFLKPNGFLLLEIGFNQASEAAKMFSPEIWSALDILPDLQGIPRTLKAVKSEK
jgi:release factor glutamine methyltransferase